LALEERCLFHLTNFKNSKLELFTLRINASQIRSERTLDKMKVLMQKVDERSDERPGHLKLLKAKINYSTIQTIN